MARLLVIAAALAFLAGPVFAQQPLKLDIKDGRVNLDAASVPARLILAEWAKVGGTKVVGGDKVSGAPLTLKLVNMPERQALDIILRNVAGYMAAPRLASAAPGASAYDRILILPTSAAAASAAANSPRAGMPSSPGPMAGLERRAMPPRPPGMMPRPGEQPEAPEPVEQPEPEEPDNGVINQQPVFTFPQPQNPGNQVFVPVPPNFGAPGTPGSSQPMIQLQPNANGQPTIYNFTPSTNAPTPVGGGFQVIGSPTPGVVQQPVVQPGQPVPPKPPGAKN